MFPQFSIRVHSRVFVAKGICLYCNHHRGHFDLAFAYWENYENPPDVVAAHFR
jgi:hypothetical protein